ncbi:MAG TPA: tRNA dimethylallyltransferase, partial [Clostridia bacterium]|nr:tRNA dimethylallyltransferase [Clostridia bacterium]
RALEIYYGTGEPMSSLKNTDNKGLIEPEIIIGLTMPRDILYRRINNRVDRMVKKGLVDEVKMLKDLGCGPECQSMQGIGYKEFFPYFEGKASLNDTIELIKKNSRNYAKRQLTWFKKYRNTLWINSEMAGVSVIGSIVCDYIKRG